MTRPIWTEEEAFLVAERGHALLLQGRYKEATIIFEGLVALDPSNVYCVNALAALYIRQGKIVGAIELLTRILEIYPNDVDTRARRCEALLMVGHVKEARKDWDALSRPSRVLLGRLGTLIEMVENRTIIA
jgi:tetratricopeptide (TPR) repeat protein